MLVLVNGKVASTERGARARSRRANRNGEPLQSVLALIPETRDGAKALKSLKASKQTRDAGRITVFRFDVQTFFAPSRRLSSFFSVFFEFREKLGKTREEIGKMEKEGKVGEERDVVGEAERKISGKRCGVFFVIIEITRTRGDGFISFAYTRTEKNAFFLRKERFKSFQRAIRRL